MRKKITIVTAASSNHYRCVQNLGLSISLFQPDADFILYDVGLSESENAALMDVPPFYLKGFELRKFDFTKYPPHFSMERFSGRLAWRPAALDEVCRERGGLVLWLDAGCLLTTPIIQFASHVERLGVSAPLTPGSIRDNLHPSSWAAFGVSDEVLDKQMRDAGMTAVNTANPSAMSLVRKWAQVAWLTELVGPEGSTRRTHRQDAVLSVLFYQAGFSGSVNLNLMHHQDLLTFSQARFFLTGRARA